MNSTQLLVVGGIVAVVLATALTFFLHLRSEAREEARLALLEKESEQPRPHFETEFDIEGQDVFSIERTDGRTCIGYWNRKGKAGNWWLVISADEHNAFAARLRKKLGREANEKPVA